MPKKNNTKKKPVDDKDLSKRSFHAKLQKRMDNVSFEPTDTVTFVANGKWQKVYWTIGNDTDQMVLFKMKSTNPMMYKMRPTYDFLMPGYEMNVALYFLGLREGDKIPLCDRFTCHFMCTPSTSEDTINRFMQPRWAKLMLCDYNSRKKSIEIRFSLYEDEMPKPPPGEDKPKVQTPPETPPKSQQSATSVRSEKPENEMKPGSVSKFFMKLGM